MIITCAFLNQMCIQICMHVTAVINSTQNQKRKRFLLKRKAQCKVASHTAIEWKLSYALVCSRHIPICCMCGISNVLR